MSIDYHLSSVPGENFVVYMVLFLAFWGSVVLPCMLYCLWPGRHGAGEPANTQPPAPPEGTVVCLLQSRYVHCCPPPEGCLETQFVYVAIPFSSSFGADPNLRHTALERSWLGLSQAPAGALIHVNGHWMLVTDYLRITLSSAEWAKSLKKDWVKH